MQKKRHLTLCWCADHANAQRFLTISNTTTQLRNVFAENDKHILIQPDVFSLDQSLMLIPLGTVDIYSKSRDIFPRFKDGMIQSTHGLISKLHAGILIPQS